MTVTAPAPTVPQLPGPVHRRRVRLLLWPFLAVVQVLRVILRKLLWVTIRTVRFAWRHLLVVILVALGAFYASRALLTEQGGSVNEPAVRTAPVIAPPPSVRAYLEAQRDFDAERMWQTLSPEAKARRLASGESLATFRQSIQLLQEQGFRFEDSTYVGGYRLPDGQAYYFYVTEVRNANDQRGMVYQIFWVDSDGLIFLVDTPQLQ
ncbi:hypothetical protein NET03_07580 [Thermomicrobium sp. CFH 73360]|uniref:hypothetical protein n=1 Tax=Thermomicrobium sp. CFH 73360 TaxID=2951987 RepID=UPI0020773693|nr:hypothetical protein [Thermomicrobium sp. CFH 73360]MCM8746392.1 hypothetical protein [Thermomicrobium sp. CFH 73360]